jgi:hypothetical protein
MPSAISDAGRIDLLEIKAVRLADRARHAFFHQSFEKETKDPALNSVSSGSSNSERKKFSHRENKPPRCPISIMELGALHRVPRWHADVYAVAGCRIAG